MQTIRKKTHKDKKNINESSLNTFRVKYIPTSSYENIVKNNKYWENLRNKAQTKNENKKFESSEFATEKVNSLQFRDENSVALKFEWESSQKFKLIFSSLYGESWLKWLEATSTRSFQN